MGLAMRLNLGSCGRVFEGYLSVDVCPPADVVADLNERWPWADSSVDAVKAFDIFEHLRDKRHALHELHRVLRAGARAEIEVPCAAHGSGAFQDPTHVSFWTGNDFEYYEAGNPHRERFGPVYGITARFRVVRADHSKYQGRFDEVWKFHVVLEAVK